MIASMVTFKDAQRLYTTEELTAIFEGSAPHYRGMDGLRSKVYWIDAERGEFGGFYLWESREQMIQDEVWSERDVIARSVGLPSGIEPALPAHLQFPAALWGTLCLFSLTLSL